jgi:hypothetical protein
LRIQTPQIWNINDDTRYFEIHLKNDQPVRALQVALTFNSKVIAGVSPVGDHRTSQLFQNRFHEEPGRLIVLQVDFKNRLLATGEGSIAVFRFRSEPVRTGHGAFRRGRCRQ